MQTKGEYRVGVTFNPSGSERVDEIKKLSAQLIDLIEGIVPVARENTVNVTEVLRLKALAQTSIEEGAMWAVKAATKPVPLA